MRSKNNEWIDCNNLNRVLSEIGLKNPNGDDYKERRKKYEQVFSFIDHLEKALDKLSTKREILLVDCACGKSYLSFIANYYFTQVQNRKVRFCCIDYNEQVIETSKRAAEALGFKNMNFICSDIFMVEFKENPDIVYSLHACDTATDMTIAKGVLEKSKFILTVSCCQHSVRESMKHHGLGSITKHGIYKERLSDMVADSMRALVLESQGYKVSLFEYVPSSHTPKNIMVRATRIGTVSSEKAMQKNQEYDALERIFNTQPKLNEFIGLRKSLENTQTVESVTQSSAL